MRVSSRKLLLAAVLFIAAPGCFEPSAVPADIRPSDLPGLDKSKADGPVRDATSIDLTDRKHGAISGAETHKLTIAEMPVHDHARTGYSAGTGSGGVIVVLNDTGGKTHSYPTKSSGSGSAHNIMQPSLALNYIIKY